MRHEAFRHLPPAERLGRQPAHRDVAPVIAAEALLRHGLSDDEVLGWLSRTWPMDAAACHSALHAGHALLRRERSAWSAD
jgi:hypothetical protein